MKSLNIKLVLSESKISSAYELFHRVIENLVIFNWIFFKNRPRLSFLILRSFLINTVVFGLYYVIFSNINFIFMGMEIEPLLLFAGSVSLSYWVMAWSFFSKNELSLYSV